MPQQETLTAPGAAGEGSWAEMQLTGPARAPVLRHAQARVSLLPVCLEEAVRSDKHAPLPVRPWPSPQFPAVLASVTAGVPAAHGSGQPTSWMPGCPLAAPTDALRHPDHLLAGSAFLHDPGG